MTNDPPTTPCPSRAAIRAKASRGLQPGDCFIARRTFTEAEVRHFAAMSRDYNPVHFEPRWTTLKGFQRPVCHGLLVGSLLTEIGGQIGWLASSMAFRFRRPVYPGDTVTCRMTLLAVDERWRARAEAVFLNQRQETVIEANLEGIVPGPGEQALLQEMMAAGDPTNGLAGGKDDR
ncbi:MAG TPA: MaoC family dehydratase [Desulfobacteraceae bacterium]|nr:MaoC family dehydratase [Deltaproteobacteria bacterium]MBW2355168.1 MaoC family dehydratase [Deltaproteobacteria bacterium]RLB98600.1 MAG: acyl dehydratase [Deltaproteobacteria bacterium]HDI59378.1 MaoC family dehydratase [Desulfobacteraceae bacterium]